MEKARAIHLLNNTMSSLWHFVGRRKSRHGLVYFGLASIFTVRPVSIPGKTYSWLPRYRLNFAPHLFFIPLVEKTNEIKEKSPRWMLLWLSIVFLMMFASDWINFLPSTQTKITALLISVVLTFPVIRTVWNRVPKADEKFLAFGAGALLVAGMHYFALSTVPPTLVSRIWGEQSITHATAVRKRHSNKLTRCSNKVDITFIDDDAKYEICLSEENWKQITNGSSVTVKIQESSYGRLVTEVAPLAVDTGLTK